jgi:hypothetical protein
LADRPWLDLAPAVILILGVSALVAVEN